MLMKYLEKAHDFGMEAIEIEYQDGKEWIFGYRGNIGAGIGSVPSSKLKIILREMDELKKTKQVTLGGVGYRLKLSRYESFMEWVYRIELRPLPSGHSESTFPNRARKQAASRRPKSS